MFSEEDMALFGRFCAALELVEGCREFAALIPEVRTNMVYARELAQLPDEVIAVDGRITTVNGMPHAAGRPRLGASSHMARLIIELMHVDPTIRAGINFANNPELADWLAEYSKERGWGFSVIDRSREPAEFRDAEEGSMPWKAKEAIRAAGGKIPRLFYETGAVGKEPVSVLVGTDPVSVANEVIGIARRWAVRTAPAVRIGKISGETFAQFLETRMGRKDPSVLVPPKPGIDAGVIDTGGGQVLVVAEDPIFAVPGQPLEMFGWYTVHIGASDVAVMGVRPRYMTYSLLLPPETPESDFDVITASIHRAAEELGIAIVGGHTGFYPGFAAPTIGGVTVFAIAPRDAYVTPAGARAGNDIILTKGPAVEAAGILAVLREQELRERYPSALVRRAQALTRQMSVVKDAMTAMAAGGVTAMHDATEGGVLGGLFEIAQASGVGMDVDEAAMIYPEEIRAVCETFHIDPLAAIAEGSLLITAAKESSSDILAALDREHIEATVIGTVTPDPGTRTIRRRDGSTTPIAPPSQDPFWPVFFEGVRRNTG
jgi:hydrogenase maturation factor/predicted fused transcriptional regulator/phosphomethylpyrimidine kinase